MNIFRIIKIYICRFRQLIKFRSKQIYISRGSFIHPKALIGRCTRINAISHIGECKIGAFCAIGGRLVVRSSNHFHNFLNMQDWAQRFVIKSNVKVVGKSNGKVEIGNAVWIGDSVIVLPNVKIDTIDSFQGQERDLIIISLVRSNENAEIGFLKDYRRLNVALTRARKKLIVIGDSATLASDKFYGQFMDYIDSIDAYHSAYEFMYE